MNVTLSTLWMRYSQHCRNTSPTEINAKNLIDPYNTRNVSSTDLIIVITDRSIMNYIFFFKKKKVKYYNYAGIIASASLALEKIKIYFCIWFQYHSS